MSKKILLVLVLIVIGLIGSQKIRKNSIDRIMSDLYKASRISQDENLFLSILNSPQSRMVLSRATRLIMKMNFYIADNRLNKVKEVEQEILQVKLNETEQLAYYQAVYGYAIEYEQTEEAKLLLKQMKERWKTSKDPNIIFFLLDSELTYDIYINHDITRIKDLKQLIEYAPDNESKSIYQFRMAKCCKYKKDFSSCRKYLMEARNNTSQSTAIEKIDKILKNNLEGL